MITPEWRTETSTIYFKKNATRRKKKKERKKREHNNKNKIAINRDVWQQKKERNTQKKRGRKSLARPLQNKVTWYPFAQHQFCSSETKSAQFIFPFIFHKTLQLYIYIYIFLFNVSTFLLASNRSIDTRALTPTRQPP